MSFFSFRKGCVNNETLLPWIQDHLFKIFGFVLKIKIMKIIIIKIINGVQIENEQEKNRKMTGIFRKNLKIGVIEIFSKIIKK